MTVTEAINKARDRVSASPFGYNQYVVHNYVPGKGTYVSHPMDYWHSRIAVRENRISVALELLGLSNDAADAAAQRDERTDWRATVRDAYRKYDPAKEQALEKQAREWLASQTEVGG